jgi:hypothetical protein
MTKYQIKGFAFIGRTKDEYMKMFDLSLNLLEGKSILDFPGGACSFAAEGRELGLDTTCADIEYGRTARSLLETCENDVERAMSGFDNSTNLFNLKEMYGDLEGLKKNRISAYQAFLNDYLENPDRYKKTRLPKSQFKDNQFDLVLSGHFLFLYSDRVSYDFHLKALEELARIGKEVRIYPLIGLNGKSYLHTSKLIQELTLKGINGELLKTNYEFLKGANMMLKLNKR